MKYLQNKEQQNFQTNNSDQYLLPNAMQLIKKKNKKEKPFERKKSNFVHVHKQIQKILLPFILKIPTVLCFCYDKSTDLQQKHKKKRKKRKIEKKKTVIFA